MVRAIIETGDIAESLSTRGKKNSAILLIDFLECLQAVAGKARTYDVDTAYTGFGQFL
jgi:hypothetical protein